MAHLTIQQAFETALIHHQSGRLVEAEQLYRQVLTQSPHHAGATHHLGVIASQVGRSDIAVNLIRHALKLNPDDANAYSNLGNALRDQGQPDEAIEAYQKALAIIPNDAEIRCNLGNAFKAKGQIDQAIAEYRQAMAIQPGNEKIHGAIVYAMCFLSGCSGQAIYQEARRWNERHARHFVAEIKPWGNDPDPCRPLRIGYVSPNFRQHTNGLAMLPLLNAHDRAGFRIVCYSDVGRPDSITARCQNAVDHWRNIVGLSDEQVAQMVRQDRIDILVDLASHMADNRLLVFARKPAPVQTTYLCNQGTTGLSTIDYRISDPHVDPEGLHDADYSEKTLRLPDCYLCFEPLPGTPPVNDVPALRNGCVTFGSLNNFCKVNPQVLDLWSRILADVRGSRLILRCPEGNAQRKVIELFAKRKIAASRIDFYSKWLSAAEYLLLHQSMDVYLDPFPHAGHTTSMDALWMGVPLITLSGQTAGGRGGVFLLANLGMENLIAETEQEYLEKAVSLAKDMNRQVELRATLRDRMQRSPLMDATAFARNIEAIYRKMWQFWCEGDRAKALARCPAPK